jgi:hypothetical protein
MVDVYYVSPKGNRHRIAYNIPYDLVDKLLHALRVKKNIDLHPDDLEIRPNDYTQYSRSSSQFESDEQLDENAIPDGDYLDE